MQQGLLRWAIILTISFPILTLALGEVAFALEERQNPLLKLAQIMRNWILPSLTAFLILQKIIILPENNLLYRVVETILGVTLICGGWTLIDILLFQEARETWVANPPRNFLDLSRTFFILVGTVAVISQVWNIDLPDLLTVLGVGFLVIGFAFLDSLGILPGIASLFKRPIAIGDWVEIGDVRGEVKQITWRSVQIYTLEKHLVIVPNSELAKKSFKNYSRVEAIHGVEIEIKFSVNDPPNKAIEVLKQAASQTQGVLDRPAPKVWLTSQDDWFILYKVVLFVENYVRGIESKHEFQLRVWYASQSHNLTMTHPDI